MKGKDMWSNAINYYEELEKEGYDVLAQLELIKKISVSQYAETLYPISYAHALNLSTTMDYGESLNKPSISIKYLKNDKFKVTYAPSSYSNRDTQYILPFSEVWSLLESLFLRLEMEEF